MKFFNTLICLFLFLFITSCFNHSKKWVIGSDIYGKNRVVKTQTQHEIVAVDTIAIIDKITTASQPGSIRSNQNKKIALPPELLKQIEGDSLHKKVSFVKAKEQLKEVQKHLTVTPSAITHHPKQENSEDPSTSTGMSLILIILIILGIIALLGILVTQLIIYAAGKTTEAALEEFGCYIATMTYGSYDHPKVMTLRRFRDQFLAKYNWGRRFIRFYYRYSPVFVKRFENNRRVNQFIRFNLNIFVRAVRLFITK